MNQACNTRPAPATSKMLPIRRGAGEPKNALVAQLTASSGAPKKPSDEERETETSPEKALSIRRRSRRDHPRPQSLAPPRLSRIAPNLLSIWLIHGPRHWFQSAIPTEGL